MSLTPEAYETRQWRGLEALRSALSDSKVDDRHYGWSSAHYNNFESISDLLEIGILTLDNIEKIVALQSRDIDREVYELSDMMRGAAALFQNMADSLKRGKRP